MTKSTTRVRTTGVSHEEEKEIQERELGQRLIPSPIKKTTFKAVKKDLEEKERKALKKKRRAAYDKLPKAPVLLKEEPRKPGRPANSPDGLTRKGVREYHRNLEKQGPMFRQLIKGLDRKTQGKKTLERLRKIKVPLI